MKKANVLSCFLKKIIAITNPIKEIVVKNNVNNDIDVNVLL